MLSGNSGTLIVVSKNDACFERCRRLWCTSYDANLRCISDSVDACELRAGTECHLVSGPRVVAAVIDLAVPMSEIQRGECPSRDEAEATLIAERSHFAWSIKVFAGIVNSLPDVPLLIVSSNRELRVGIKRMALTHYECVMPSASEEEWSSALARCMAMGPEEERIQGERIDLVPDSWIPVKAQIWFDTERFMLIHPGGVTPLTAQEARIMSALTSTPRRIHSLKELARRLVRPGFHNYDIDEHCVEQLVSTLRRKLGENAKHPYVFTSRRGLGYGILP